MSLTLYNTLSRKKETFKPIVPGKVGLYTCGPTVYNFAHIGNLRSYIFEDILRRVLEYNNFQVNHVMNITDVGHLTSDSDDGEDKMLKGAQRENKTVWEIAEYYTNVFFDDLKKLNINSPHIKCKATDHIKEMIELNQRIEKNGFAYFKGGNLYFDTSKLEDYGKLALLKLDTLKEGARVDKDPNKKNAQDFVLWFTKSKFGDQDMQWDSPWGRGFPGWHIECSAMSIKYLGEQFDIHCGGVDHIPVHHTNELAQSESATGKKPWVKYWLHGEFLVIDKGKMAKSGENFLTLQTIIDKGYNPIDYRYMCLSAHYKQQLSFSFEALDTAKNALNSIKNKIIELEEQKEGDLLTEKINHYNDEFLESINEDLNMPKALAVLWRVIKDEELNTNTKLTIIFDFDKVFGLNLSLISQIEIPKEITDLAEQRLKARSDKNWQLSDELRDKIKEQGYIVDDTKDSYRIKKE